MSAPQKNEDPEIQLYNTLTRRKEVFQPLDPARVRMYVCGPTVYDEAHIGNARPVVVFDLLFRLLRARFGADHVVYARNITDIDDKIILRAAESGEPIAALTERTTTQYHKDMAALGCLDPTVEPRATAHIGQMIGMIERLIASGHAYAADGHVLFEVSTYPAYGALSRRSLDEQIAGARVEVAPYKRSPGDFVLWKPSDPDQPGWDSPWGRGRPGWHIECSAMADAHLGARFDIHGGGIDLIFPHHENEIAQTRCALPGAGATADAISMAQIWMHNGFVTVDGAKMSKSLGNFTTVRQLRQRWHGEVIRLALMMTHYRAELDMTEARLEQAKTLLGKWHRRWKEWGAFEDSKEDNPVQNSLTDDLDSVGAIEVLNDLYVANNPGLVSGARFLGLLQSSPEQWFRWEPPRDLTVDLVGFSATADLGTLSVSTSMRLPDEEVDRLIDSRNAARKARSFAEADRIRAELTEQGIVLEDGPSGTTWRRA
jgi:cysteinyl-tRNA synthetase